MGYHRAGFDVVGVDNKPQKHYPFKFHQADALEYLKEYGQGFDVIHASPPCQKYSMAGQQWRKAGKKYVDLVVPTRKVLRENGRPYIIENVPGASLINPILLNGAMFGINLCRKRLFECSFDIPFMLIPKDRPSTFRMGRPVKDGDMITPVGHFSNIPYARKVMGIDWMTGQEMTQAIPPVYTEFIGRKLIEYLTKPQQNASRDTLHASQELIC
jgi:DNA (cytosine-5)-methyltransferase 1